MAQRAGQQPPNLWAVAALTLFFLVLSSVAFLRGSTATRGGLPSWVLGAVLLLAGVVGLRLVVKELRARSRPVDRTRPGE